MSSSSTTRDAVPRRRNGRQQACEPCSRRKVACDHRLPVCSRCQRSLIPEKCVYVAERRRAAFLATPTSPRSPSQRAVSDHGAVAGVGAGYHDAQSAKGMYQGDPGSGTTSPENDAPRLRGSKPQGYLGATSFNAVLEEAQETLVPSELVTPLTEPRLQRADGESYTCASTSSDGLTHNSDPVVSDMAMSILRSLPDYDASYILFGHYINPNRGWCFLAAQRLFYSFWETFGNALDGRSSDGRVHDEAALAGIAEKLHRNTSRAWDEDEADPAIWFSQFSGANLRWEALGMLFIFWAFGVRSFPMEVPVRGYGLLDNAGRHSLQLKYKECAWRCTELARRQKSFNSLMVWTLWKHSMMESTISGDASLQHWRLHADVVAVTSYLGLHVSTAPVNDRSISVQIKRRMYADVYKMDKVGALFSGRPPLMSARYATQPLPLDISDEELMGVVPQAPGHLDEDGWNTEGKAHLTTILRARAVVAVVGEGILEMMLQNQVDNARERLLDLRRQEMEAVSKFPSSIAYQETDPTDNNVDETLLYTRLLIRLEHLQNLFLICRMLYRQGCEDDATVVTELIELSYEMVSLALVFWTHQDRLGYLKHALEWLFVQYAAPGGGILCMELLQPCRLNRRATAGERPPLSMTRSQIVQKLSLLVAFLDWVSPDAPNSDPCCQIKRVVSRALDQALNVPAPGSSAAAAAGGGGPGGRGETGADGVGTADLGAGLPASQESLTANWDMEDFPVDLNEFFSFDLLDTFDWLRPEGEATVGGWAV